MTEETIALRQIDELERLASTGLPVWSEELTDQVDPVLAELDRVIGDDPAARDEVLKYVSGGGNPVVAEWLRLHFRPDLSLDEENLTGTIQCAGVTIATRPALFLAQDSISVPEKKLRKLKRPWEHAPGWFFGKPQRSPATDAWPLASDGTALDFIVQIDLAQAAGSFPGFESIGLPDDVTLQIFVDLDTEDGPVDHRVIAFRSGEGAKGVLKPPRGNDVNEADPILINPVGALTLAITDDHTSGVEAVQGVLREYADSAPYEMNLFSHATDSPGLGPEQGYVPMARLGGVEVEDAKVRRRGAADALKCRPEDIFVLYDGPVDPEPTPVPDPDRSRFTVLIERARLDARDFDVTYAIWS
ncbi:DUF1963 domain-containing protein [Aeromicrobium senzhongii]|uniref:DUF1963 domain-containing protein n=1 Tax=Aeromicrobium senzhongii TaxID=2663859 RepID=A0ABX6SVX6_9ACTN|nr:DUF1963 domain-containing protein [Aeromicrobium senzhongii]MTB88437.1 DUF1963 domain-containing protein [Aeromicrobium senzhongii]QNL94599.1 DUF1963 domain-containing protein [Aeromicrobium senzhongii]